MEQLGSPSVSIMSVKPNVYAPRPSLRQFLNLVPCNPKRPISFESTLSGRSIGYCLLTVSSFCLLNKYLSSYGGMFIKMKAMSIKKKAIWQRLESSTSLYKFLCTTAATQPETTNMEESKMSATVNFSVFITPTLADKLLSLVGSADFL